MSLHANGASAEVSTEKPGRGVRHSRAVHPARTLATLLLLFAAEAAGGISPASRADAPAPEVAMEARARWIHSDTIRYLISIYAVIGKIEVIPMRPDTTHDQTTIDGDKSRMARLDDHR